MNRWQSDLDQDSLRAARGIYNGLLLGLLFWLVIAGLWWLL